METDTIYQIKTDDKQKMDLMLNAERMSLALLDLLNWEDDIVNGKNYGEGRVLYKGKLYDKEEWCKLDIPDEDRDESYMLKEKPVFLYTEKELENKLNDITEDVRDFIYNHYHYY